MYVNQENGKYKDAEQKVFTQKIKTYVPKLIWLYTIIGAALFFVLCLGLALLGMAFRAWVYTGAAVVLAAGLVAGLVQIILRIKKRVCKTICIASSIIFLYYVSWFSFVAVIFGYMPEYVVEREGQKYVVFVDSFLKTSVYYYDYKNFLVMGRERRIEEYYGKAHFDPEDMEGNLERVERVIYFDGN